MRLSEKMSKGLKNLPFFNRPLAFLCAVLLCAIFCFELNLILFIIYAAALVLYSLWLLFKHGFGFKANPLPYFILITLLICSLLPLPTHLNYKKLSSLSGEHTVTATIEDSLYEESFGALYYARLTEIDGKKVSGYAEIEFTEAVDFFQYDTITVSGNVNDKRTGISGSELMNAISNNVCLDVTVNEFKGVTNDAKNGISYKLYLIRNSMRQRLFSLLSFDTASYACALLLGDKDGISHTLTTAMSALGISHILAVSGMHLSIIAMLITALAEKIKRGRKLKCVLIISGALCFMCIANFSVSVVRAAIMLIISTLSVFAGRKSDSLTSLFLSGAMLCIINPSKVLSCSFLLSFFATLGIVLCALFAERLAKISLYASRVGDMKLAYKLARGVAFSLLLTLCASLFTIPLMSLYFSSASFFSVITNPITVPMAFISVLITLLCFIFGGIPFIGALLCDGFNALYGIFKDFVISVSWSFDTAVSLRYPFFVPIIALLVCVLLFLAIKGIKNPLAVIASFTVCAIIYFSGVQIYSSINSERALIAYSCSHTAEGFTVISGEQSVYVDIGNGSKKLPTDTIENIKNDYYEVAIDGYMLTHYHSAHIGTVSRLLQNTKIKSLYLPAPNNDKEASIRDQIKAIAPHCKIIEYERGQKVNIGKIDIQTTKLSLLERSEHPVICMRFSCGQKSITYIASSVSESDVYVQAEEFIAESDAIICGRHGPITKENNKFLSYSSAKQVYISPYEDIDENAVFEGGAFTYITPSSDTVIGFSLILSLS